MRSLWAGGPAGSAAALAIRAKGWSVTLLEAAPNFSPSSYKKVCGSFLNAEAVRALAEMDLLESVLKEGGRPVTSFLMTEPSGRAARTSLGSSGGGPLCVRRAVLDRVLLEQAARRGVRVEMGVEVQQVEDRRVSYSGGEIQSDTVVLADGKPCRWGLRESRGFGKISGAQGWFGWNADYSDPAGSSSRIELHLFKEGYIGLLGVEPGVTHVCGLSRQRLLRQAEGDFDTLVERAAWGSAPLQERLRNMARLTSWRAVGPLPFGRMSPLSDSHCLVGDAAAVIDPFVGGGIGMALQSGRLLGSVFEKAMSAGERRRSYDRLWNHCFQRRLTASRYLRACLDETWRLRCLVSLLGQWPSSLEILTRFLFAQAA